MYFVDKFFCDEEVDMFLGWSRGDFNDLSVDFVG